MGKSGPPKTPQKILEQRGSWRSKLNPDMPQVEPGRPVKPEWLGKYARHAWDQLIPKLEDMGVLTQMDGDALINYCVLWGRWRKCEEFLESKGQTYPVMNEHGDVVGVKEFPQAKIAGQLAGQLLRIQNNFGLTPSARSNIVIPEKAKQVDGTAKYLKIV